MSVDFQSIADYYDLMYVDEKEYRREAEQVRSLILEYGRSGNRNLLDLACGTGAQSRYLSEWFSVTGLDISQEMLAVAKRKVPAARFVWGDMTDFHLGERFGAAVNLYGSIGFCESRRELERSLRCTADHLEEGGLLILTPWDTRETFREGMEVDSGRVGEMAFCRMEAVRRFKDRPDQVRVEMRHLVSHGLEITEFHHIQEISLFSEEEYRQSIQGAGLTLVRRLSEAEFRMGAFVCRKES